MLKIKEPIKLKSAGIVRESYEGFHNRIMGNYGQIDVSIGSADLLHALTQPPEVFLAEGDNVIVNNQNNNQINIQENKLSVLENVVNRIMLSADEHFTYQDSVYISNILHRLGIRDEKNFLKQFNSLVQEGENIDTRLNLLNRHINELLMGRDSVKKIEREIRTEGAVNVFNRYESGDNLYDNSKSYGYTDNSVRTDRNEKEQQLTFLNQNNILSDESFSEKNADVNPSEQKKTDNNYYLHQEIFKRLNTREVYEAVSSYNSVYEGESVSSTVLNMAEQGSFVKYLSLTNSENRLSGSDAPLVYHRDNSYEEVSVKEGDVINEETLMQDLSRVLLLSLSDRLYQTAFGGKTGNSNTWLSVKNSLYTSVENTLKRYQQNLINPVSDVTRLYQMSDEINNNVSFSQLLKSIDVVVEGSEENDVSIKNTINTLLEKYEYTEQKTSKAIESISSNYNIGVKSENSVNISGDNVNVNTSEENIFQNMDNTTTDFLTHITSGEALSRNTPVEAELRDYTTYHISADLVHHLEQTLLNEEDYESFVNDAGETMRWLNSQSVDLRRTYKSELQNIAQHYFNSSKSDVANSILSISELINTGDNVENTSYNNRQDSYNPAAFEGDTVYSETSDRAGDTFTYVRNAENVSDIISQENNVLTENYSQNSFSESPGSVQNTLFTDNSGSENNISTDNYNQQNSYTDTVLVKEDNSINVSVSNADSEILLSDNKSEFNSYVNENVSDSKKLYSESTEVNLLKTDVNSFSENSQESNNAFYNDSLNSMTDTSINRLYESISNIINNGFTKFSENGGSTNNVFNRESFSVERLIHRLSDEKMENGERENPETVIAETESVLKAFGGEIKSSYINEINNAISSLYMQNKTDTAMYLETLVKRIRKGDAANNTFDSSDNSFVSVSTVLNSDKSDNTVNFESHTEENTKTELNPSLFNEKNSTVNISAKDDYYSTAQMVHHLEQVFSNHEAADDFITNAGDTIWQINSESEEIRNNYKRELTALAESFTKNSRTEIAGSLLMLSQLINPQGNITNERNEYFADEKNININTDNRISNSVNLIHRTDESLENISSDVSSSYNNYERDESSSTKSDVTVNNSENTEVLQDIKSVNESDVSLFENNNYSRSEDNYSATVQDILKQINGDIYNSSENTGSVNQVNRVVMPQTAQTLIHRFSLALEEPSLEEKPEDIVNEAVTAVKNLNTDLRRSYINELNNAISGLYVQNRRDIAVSLEKIVSESVDNSFRRNISERNVFAGDNTHLTHIRQDNYSDNKNIINGDTIHNEDNGRKINITNSMADKALRELEQRTGLNAHPSERGILHNTFLKNENLEIENRLSQIEEQNVLNREINKTVNENINNISENVLKRVRESSDFKAEARLGLEEPEELLLTYNRQVKEAADEIERETIKEISKLPESERLYLEIERRIKDGSFKPDITSSDEARDILNSEMLRQRVENTLVHLEKESSERTVEVNNDIVEKILKNNIFTDTILETFDNAMQGDMVSQKLIHAMDEDGMPSEYLDNQNADTANVSERQFTKIRSDIVERIIKDNSVKESLTPQKNVFTIGSRSVNIVHRQQDTLDEEEIIERLKEEKTMVSDTDRQVREVNNTETTTINRRQETQEVVNEMISGMRLENMIQNGVRQQLSALSEQVFSRLERKLLNEKRRRGI